MIAIVVYVYNIYCSDLARYSPWRNLEPSALKRYGITKNKNMLPLSLAEFISFLEDFTLLSQSAFPKNYKQFFQDEIWESSSNLFQFFLSFFVLFSEAVRTINLLIKKPVLLAAGWQKAIPPAIVIFEHGLCVCCRCGRCCAGTRRPCSPGRRYSSSLSPSSDTPRTRRASRGQSAVHLYCRHRQVRYPQ